MSNRKSKNGFAPHGDGKSGGSGISTAGSSAAFLARPVIRETAEAIQIAKFIFDKYNGKKLDFDKAYLDPRYASLELSPYRISANRVLYQTYIGDYPGHPPRFNLDYIYRIELHVLNVFMLYLRRADYLNETGNFTGIVTAPDSIVVNFRSQQDQSFVAADLATLELLSPKAVYGPFAGGHYQPVRFPGDPGLIPLDDICSAFPIGQFANGEKSPKYDNPKNLYYDRVSECTTEQGTMLIPI